MASSMRSGDLTARPSRCAYPNQRGFTYLAILLAVGLIGLGLTAGAEVWSMTGQRAREKELLFVGHQIRNAIRSYAQATPGPVPRYPITLEDLLQDNRYPGVKRHLRRLYRDPMTGNAQWGILPAPGGGVLGVYSLSGERPVKTSSFDDEDRTFEGATTYADWQFVYIPPSVPSGASGAAGPAGVSAPPATIK